MSPVPRTRVEYEDRRRTCEVVLQAKLSESLGDDLPKSTGHLAFFQKLLLSGWVVLHTVELLFKLHGEGNDIPGKTAVLGHPLGDLGQILALLPEVVFHGEIHKVDDWLRGDELNLLIDEGDLGWRPGTVSDRLILL